MEYRFSTSKMSKIKMVSGFHIIEEDNIYMLDMASERIWIHLLWRNYLIYEPEPFSLKWNYSSKEEAEKALITIWGRFIKFVESFEKNEVGFEN